MKLTFEQARDRARWTIRNIPEGATFFSLEELAAKDMLSEDPARQKKGDAELNQIINDKYKKSRDHFRRILAFWETKWNRKQKLEEFLKKNLKKKKS